MAYKYISPSGVIVPDTSEILAETNQEWKDVFGQDLDVNPETPQGIYIASDVAVRSEVAANNAALANQINPMFTGGIFLDDIWALTGGKRRKQTYTLVEGVELHGIPGVVVPPGSRRATAAGDLFELLSTVVLDSTGKGIGVFQALNAGPIPCGANTLTEPVRGYTSVGWETSTNPQAGVIGRDRQSDLSAKQERRQTLALQGRSLPEAVYSRVRALEGVRSMQFLENYDDVDKTISGIQLRKNSIWVCVDGGKDADIAEALYKSKNGGTGYNGAVSVVYREPFFNQPNTIKFDRPTAKPIMAKITGRIIGSVSGNPEAIIKQAVVDYADGLLDNGEVGFVVGMDISPYEVGAAVNYVIPQILITKVELADKAVTPTWGVNTISIALNEKGGIDLDSVLVVLS